MAAINVGNLHKAVTKAAADKQELINLRADLNDPKDGVDVLNEAEKLICKAKGQINRAAMIQLVGRPTIEHKTKGKELRAQLSKVIKSVNGLKLQEHIGKSLLAQARIITEDKNADPHEEDPEATADKRGVGLGKRQRAEEDAEASPPKKENNKTGAR